MNKKRVEELEKRLEEYEKKAEKLDMHHYLAGENAEELGQIFRAARYWARGSYSYNAVCMLKEKYRLSEIEAGVIIAGYRAEFAKEKEKQGNLGKREQWEIINEYCAAIEYLAEAGVNCSWATEAAWKRAQELKKQAEQIDSWAYFCWRDKEEGWEQELEQKNKAFEKEKSEVQIAVRDAYWSMNAAAEELKRKLWGDEITDCEKDLHAKSDKMSKQELLEMSIKLDQLKDSRFKKIRQEKYSSHNDLKLSEEEIKLIEIYEMRAGKQVLMTREEKIQAYLEMSPEKRHEHTRGLEREIAKRNDLKNAEDYEGDDDWWKLKVYQNNLAILYEIEAGEEEESK